MWLTLRFFQTERFSRPWPFRPSCSTLRGPQQETNTWVHCVVLVLRLWSPFSKNFFIFPFSEWIPPQKKHTFCFFFCKAYVSDYNIFLKPSATAETVQLTSNGKKNEILNGIPDWIYEGLYCFLWNIYFRDFVLIFPFSSCSLVSKQFFKTTRQHNNDRLSFFPNHSRGGFCLKWRNMVVSHRKIPGLCGV